MTDHATEAAQDQHSVDLSTIASLRAQLAAANDSIARVRALSPTLRRTLHGAWVATVTCDQVDAALTPEAPR